MQYVIVLWTPDDYLADDSIESACSTVNKILQNKESGDLLLKVRPLSEVIAS